MAYNRTYEELDGKERLCVIESVLEDCVDEITNIFPTLAILDSFKSFNNPFSNLMKLMSEGNNDCRRHEESFPNFV